VQNSDLQSDLTANLRSAQRQARIEVGFLPHFSPEAGPTSPRRDMHTTPLSLLERLRQPSAQEAWGRFARLYTPVLYYWARRTGDGTSYVVRLPQGQHQVGKCGLAAMQRGAGAKN
jgi:hypothetical protein